MSLCITYMLLLSVIVYFVESMDPGRFNAALDKLTYQSSTFGEPSDAIDYRSFAAVDGNKVTNQHKKCTRTKANSINWWAVDLGHLYLVYSVSITSTSLSYPTLRNFSINYYRTERLVLGGSGYVNFGVPWSDLTCAEQPGEQAASDTQQYMCTSSPPIAARWIVVRQEDAVAVELRLCEVEVEADMACTPFDSLTRGRIDYQLPEGRLLYIPRFSLAEENELLTSPPHGTTATFICNMGFSVQGGPTSICTLNGTWTSNPASMQCQPCEGGAYGEACRRSCGRCKDDAPCDRVDGSCTECEPGFLLPDCLMPVDCGDPPAPISHGNLAPVVVSRTTVGGLAFYDCGPGYTTDSPRTRVCTIDALWSGYDVQCQPVDCGTPPDPITTSQDYQVRNILTTYQQIAAYSCGVGYVTIDQLTRTCQANGQWSGRTPQCFPVRCPILPHPAFGNVDYVLATRVLHSLAMYSCNQGYVLSGNTERQCQPDGSWSGEETECVEIDECASGPCHANSNCTDGIHGYQCSCHHGFIGHTCTQVAVNCSSNPCGDHGTCRDDGGYSCQCMAGYGGPNCDLTLSCENEQFSAAVDAAVLYTSRLLGSNLTYWCGTGWTTEDRTVRHCVPGGTGGVHWSGTAPVCHPERCGYPPSIENGIVSERHMFTYNEVAVYYCNHGYSISNATHLTCDENGEWEPSEAPSCQPYDCGVPPPPAPFSSMFYTNTTVTHEAIYYCQDGYTEIGVKTIYCMDLGLWSGVAPYCTIVVCEQPQDSSTIHLDSVQGIDVGDTAVYRCKSGYTANDSLQVQCMYSGEWSATPFCYPVDCGAPPPPISKAQDLSVTARHSTYQSIAEYSCGTGHSSDDQMTRICQANGQWSGRIPRCSPTSDVASTPPLVMNKQQAVLQSGANIRPRGPDSVADNGGAGFPWWAIMLIVVVVIAFLAIAVVAVLIYKSNRRAQVDDSSSIERKLQNIGTQQRKIVDNHTEGKTFENQSKQNLLEEGKPEKEEAEKSETPEVGETVTEEIISKEVKSQNEWETPIEEIIPKEVEAPKEKMPEEEEMHNDVKSPKEWETPIEEIFPEEPPKEKTPEEGETSVEEITPEEPPIE